ncbi:MAG: hypothetical protein IPK19_17090 [Chloroflexi bacterium]|nr:hypothetical protein [Chloroflexota bacterium]
MKQFYPRLILLGLLCLLVFATGAAAQDTETYREGLYVNRLEGHNIGATSVEINAVKQVEGSFRQSTVHITANFGGEPLWQVRYALDATFTVPDDPDWLEVSDDLGWGGMDAEVQVPIQVTRCTDVVGGNCTTTTEMTLVRIHLSAWANQGVTQTNGEYRRPASFYGSVSIGSKTFPYNGAWGHNFADRYLQEW